MTSSDPSPGFKVTVYLHVEYGQSYYRKLYTVYQMVPLSMTLSDL